MPEETNPAAHDAPEPAGAAPATETARPADGEGNGSGAPRRRRRGSRGGRNRKRPTAAAGSTDAATGVQATAPPDPAPKPKIGDTRPAPAPARSEGGAGTSGANSGAKRRSRRGGRGRGAQGRPAAPRAGATSAGVAEVTEPGDDAEVVATEVVASEPARPEPTPEERERARRGSRRTTGRYLMCVHVKPGVATHVALLEGRQLVEHYVSRPQDDTTQIHGNIYLGKVQNVLPGMEAAFVDIGTPKNGVLYRGDVAFDEGEFEGQRPKIERLLRNGQSVIVQVTKNPIGTKGARLTQEVSLAGRFGVMVPDQPQTYGISKRLSDSERRRLRGILDEVRPKEHGLIVRTAAEGAGKEDLVRDVERLTRQWDDIKRQAARAKPPKLLYREPDLAVRLIREEFNKEYRGVLIDDWALYQEVRGYVESVSPELADRVEYYDDALPLFERHHVEEQLQKALDRKVWLPSGGSLVIERTEALTVVDVNTGKFVGRSGSNLEETVFRNNLEAAEEIARQLRLRDIGGIIVIDFIDMEVERNRQELLRVFREALARDKTRTQAFGISELGIVEMTRKRVAEDLVEAFSRTCPTCGGRGIVIEEELL